MSVTQETDPSQGPRNDTPWWFLDRGADIRGLDYGILYSYYIGRLEDAEIFDHYAVDFSMEPGRQRGGTSSVEATKKRRERLVKAGNALYGEHPANI
jgi:hypothetical protein